MHLVVIGLNHETAPVHLRELLRIPEASLCDALADLRAQEGVGEGLILSTCNRTEVYAVLPNRGADAVIIRWLQQYFRLPGDDYAHHLYSHAGHKAAEHLFRVAAGIDSLVVGEAQILGQVKVAYGTACQGQYSGSILNALFQQAITVGKRARTETEIGSGAFSVSSIAVQLAKSIFGSLAGRTVLIVGASKMGELTITNLMGSGATSVMVTNRTFAKARDLAERFGGTAVEMEQLESTLGQVDIVITATAATEPIITRNMMTRVMRQRRGRPIFLVDIAVPRDIAEDVGALDNTFVYNIDDLQMVVKADLANRQAEIGNVEAIIADEVAAFIQSMNSREAVPMITALRSRFDRIREDEMARLQDKLRHLSPEDLEMINLAARSMINKISHRPMICIKEYASSEDAQVRLETVRDLFGLTPDADGEERTTK